MPARMTSRYTPRNRAELVACLIGFGDAQIVELKPAAAELLRPWEVRTMKDVLELPAWPYGRLRIVIERRPLIEVMIEPVWSAPRPPHRCEHRQAAGAAAEGLNNAWARRRRQSDDTRRGPPNSL